MQLDVQWFIYALADNDIVSAEDAVMFNDELGGDPTLEVFSQELFQAISAESPSVRRLRGLRPVFLRSWRNRCRRSRPMQTTTAC